MGDEEADMSKVVEFEIQPLTTSVGATIQRAGLIPRVIEDCLRRYAVSSVGRIVGYDGEYRRRKHANRDGRIWTKNLLISGS
jgi:hypothetical protein